MRVHIVSDIHTEFGRKFVKKCAADVLVVAGDLGYARVFQRPVAKLCRQYKYVVYVPGNHEYYFTSAPEVEICLQRLQDEHKNFIVLDDAEVTIDGVKFVGSTLWFKDDPLNSLYAGRFTDFSVIKDFKSFVYQKNERSIDFLKSHLTSDAIVITHFLPSFKSVHETYRNSQLNRFFVCDMEDLIYRFQPKIWIHGHTHFPFRYFIGETEIVCNPFVNDMYEPGQFYDPDLIIDVN